jgi:hypothetical protein
MDNTVNSRAKFLEIKESLQLDNKAISEIIGLTSGTVKNQISPSHGKVTTWMRGMVYMYNRQKKLEIELRQTEDVNRKLVQELKELKKANLQETE